jgi:dihydrofolate reductase
MPLRLNLLLASYSQSVGNISFLLGKPIVVGRDTFEILEETTKSLDVIKAKFVSNFRN